MAAGLASDAASAATRVVSTTTGAVGTAFHDRAARRLLRVLGEMKGLPLKAGQMLSYIDEAIPPEYRHHYEEVLGKLQTNTPTFDWDDICEVFHAEFDGRDPEEVFARFDREPIAAASIGQVYRGALPDGTEVVIKIQYPGVAEAMQADIDNIDVLISAFQTILPKLSFRDFVTDIIDRVMAELDYEAELDHQLTFRRCWANDPQVLVPDAYPEYCTGRVLTSEYIDGLEWKAMLASADDATKCAYGETIFRFVFGSLFVHGMFNADPHPGNYLFLPDGRVAFIDYGCVQRYDAHGVAAFRALRDRVVERDTGPAFTDALQRALGFPDNLDADLVQDLVDYMLLTVEPVTSVDQPYRFTRTYSTKLIREMMKLKLTLNKKLFTGDNVDIWGMDDKGVAFLGRINFGLGSILATLGAEADFNAMLAGMGDEGRS